MVFFVSTDDGVDIYMVLASLFWSSARAGVQNFTKKFVIHYVYCKVTCVNNSYLSSVCLGYFHFSDLFCLELCRRSFAICACYLGKLEDISKTP